jgi:hypothetical protein
MRDKKWANKNGSQEFLSFSRIFQSFLKEFFVVIKNSQLDYKFLVNGFLKKNKKS